MVKVQCIMCDDRVDILDQENHIHKHLGYLPERCLSCDFRSHSRDMLNKHVFQNAKHDPGPSCYNPYLAHLAEYISRDTLQAARHGLRAVLHKKGVGAASSIDTPSPHQRTPYSENETQSEQSSRKRVYPQSADKSDDEVEEMVVQQPRKQSAPKRTPAKSAPITNKPTATPKKSRCSVSWPAYSVSEQTTPVAACASEDVPPPTPIAPIVSPPSGQAEAITRLELYGQAINCGDFCLLCGHKVQGSRSGRQYHVMSQHYTMQLRCPIYRCTRAYVNPRDVDRHMKDAHGLEEGRKALPEPLKTAYYAARHNQFKAVWEFGEAYCFLNNPLPLKGAAAATHAAGSPRVRSTSEPAEPRNCSSKRRENEERREMEAWRKSFSFHPTERMDILRARVTKPAPIRRQEKSESELSDDEDKEKKRKKRKKMEKASNTNRKPHNSKSPSAEKEEEIVLSSDGES